MVPSLVPVPVVTGVEADGAEAAEVMLAGADVLAVWAQAEIIERTAMARKERRSLLVIGSLKLLGTLFRKSGSVNQIPVNVVSGNTVPGKNSDCLFQATLDRTHEVFYCLTSTSSRQALSDRAHRIASLTRRGCGRIVHPCSSFSNGVDRSNYRYPSQPASNQRAPIMLAQKSAGPCG